MSLKSTPARLATARTLAMAAAMATLAGTAARAVESTQPAGPSGHAELAPLVQLTEGKSTLMRLPHPVTRLSVGDASVADVILLNPSELYLLGKSTGSTNLILWNKANDSTIVDLAVGIDTGSLQSSLRTLFPAETEVRVGSAADSVVLSGTVSDAGKAAQIAALAQVFAQHGKNGPTPAGPPPAAGVSAAPMQAATAPSRVINMLSIAAPQQVMLEVQVAEVSKSLVDQLGASIGAAATRGQWTYTFLSNLLAGKPGVLDAFNNRNGNFVTLDAQKTDGLVKVLAEPTIMAISGQEASFLAGGKIFIPVAVANNNGAATITLEEKEFGIAVRFTPTVLEGGRINLKVAPEVSDLNKEGVGLSANGVNGTAILPSFTTRRASTVVQLFDGQSFAIGGLIKNNVTTSVKAFPLLGEIPVLGALFRSSDFQRDRSELVFVVTPRLVKPLPPNYRLPTDGYIEPSRSQLLLQGKVEGTPPATASAPAAPAAPPGQPAAAPAPPLTGFDLQ